MHAVTEGETVQWRSLPPTGQGSAAPCGVRPKPHPRQPNGHDAAHGPIVGKTVRRTLHGLPDEPKATAGSWRHHGRNRTRLRRGDHEGHRSTSDAARHIDGGFRGVAVGHHQPQLVQRMVVAAAACRLSDYGRWAQAELARLTKEGKSRQASAFLLGALAEPPLRRPAKGVGWLIGGSLAADDPDDMLHTIAAEDSFDVEPDLTRVQAPTLVLGGTADPFYSADLFRRTAAGVPQGRVVLFPGKSHVHVAGSAVPAAVALDSYRRVTVSTHRQIRTLAEPGRWL